jgi:hypothetical protein
MLANVIIPPPGLFAGARNGAAVKIAAVQPTHVAAEKPAVIVLGRASPAHFLLAARIASAHTLNPPKALARRRPAPVSATKPLPRSKPAASRAEAAKPHRTATPPRVIRPVRPSAEIIRLADRRGAQRSAHRAA